MAARFGLLYDGYGPRTLEILEVSEANLDLGSQLHSAGLDFAGDM